MEPLDDTQVHPESYPMARALLNAVGSSSAALCDHTTWLRDVGPSLLALVTSGDPVRMTAIGKELLGSQSSLWRDGDLMKTITNARHVTDLILRSPHRDNTETLLAAGAMAARLRQRPLQLSELAPGGGPYQATVRNVVRPS